MVVDHFYFCTGTPDKIASILIDFGLKEGEPNTHPGQGTANRRFFFQNTMMELLYMNDRGALETDRTKALKVNATVLSNMEEIVKNNSDLKIE